MSKTICRVHLNYDDFTDTIHFLDTEFTIKSCGCGGDVEKAAAIIAAHAGAVDAIALDGLPFELKLGSVQVEHAAAEQLRQAAGETLLVDGRTIRAGLERWAVILADRAQPGIFAQKRILMVPGLNHRGLSQALSRRSSQVRFADPVVYFALPQFPGVGSRQTLQQAAAPTLEQLKDAPYRRINPQAGLPGTPRVEDPFKWADLLAGDIGAIRRYAPFSLKRKIIVTEHADETDAADLRERGAAILLTMMPSLDGAETLGRWSAAVVEAALAVLRPESDAPLTEDTYLDLMADINWTPTIRYLQAEDQGVNKFAFVIHPLHMGFIHNHKLFRWTKYFPDAIVERVAAYMPPLYISRITGGQSPTTEQKIEGHLISLAATPREMMRHDPRFTYDRLFKSSQMAERLGARIMGLGAFTSVVGDAGITVAHEADIAITSGNSLTVAATLESAKVAAQRLGKQDLTKAKVMIVGATGSIGSICARLLAQAIFDVVLVSIEPERLIELKRLIQEETPQAEVSIATRADEYLPDCDLVVTATSAFGQRVIDISKCKPGAVICDVARPLDINPAEAALRPDVLVIESGEVLIPGEIDFGYDIGLPPGTAYACLAETALLAMEGRFEDYTLGRNITIERVKEIYRLFKKHQFQLAGLRSFGGYISEEEFQEKVELAEKYRQEPELFARLQEEAGAKIRAMPVMAKGVSSRRDGGRQRWAYLAAGLLGIAGVWGFLTGKTPLWRRKNG
jgi:predicted amino acid dehydrogenase